MAEATQNPITNALQQAGIPNASQSFQPAARAFEAQLLAQAGKAERFLTSTNPAEQKKGQAMLVALDAFQESYKAILKSSGDSVVDKTTDKSHYKTSGEIQAELFTLAYAIDKQCPDLGIGKQFADMVGSREFTGALKKIGGENTTLNDAKARTKEARDQRNTARREYHEKDRDAKEARTEYQEEFYGLHAPWIKGAGVMNIIAAPAMLVGDVFKVLYNVAKFAATSDERHYVQGLEQDAKLAKKTLRAAQKEISRQLKAEHRTATELKKGEAYTPGFFSKLFNSRFNQPETVKAKANLALASQLDLSAKDMSAKAQLEGKDFGVKSGQDVAQALGVKTLYQVSMDRDGNVTGTRTSQDGGKSWIQIDGNGKPLAQQSQQQAPGALANGGVGLNLSGIPVGSAPGDGQQQNLADVVAGMAGMSPEALTAAAAQGAQSGGNVSGVTTGNMDAGVTPGMEQSQPQGPELGADDGGHQTLDAQRNQAAAQLGSLTKNIESSPLFQKMKEKVDGGAEVSADGNKSPAAGGNHPKTSGTQIQ